MRWVTRTALAALFVGGVTTEGFSATPQDKPAPGKEKEDAAAAPTLDSAMGKKLVSIDGSSISITASEGGLAREIIASNGAVQKTAFRFINEKLGTVTNSRDPNNVIGVFRASLWDIEIQYADGSSETVLANPAGGISIESKSATSGPYCTAWYPEGHMFSVEDRKAALAQYASRLGLADAGDKKPDAPLRSGCGSAAPTHVTDAAPKAAPAEAPAHPAVLASAGATVTAKASARKTAAVAATAAHAIDVRTSEVHPIDAIPPAEPQPAQIAALDLNQNTSVQNAGVPNQKGASSCLSVDSDGSHWGFRNHCAYTVQFAYCLMSGSALASCRDGAVGGSVAGNGFGALVADESLKETDAAHDFRWVACQGGAGEVIPRLDQTEPPSGRCVR